MKFTVPKPTLIARVTSMAAVLAMLLTALFAPLPEIYAQQGSQWQTSDNVAALDLGGSGSGCGVSLGTGAYAANPAAAGGLSAPSLVRAQNQNMVLQVTTTAAASALTLDCDIIPPIVRTTPGKGVSITGVIVYYGVQTSALTSVTSPNTFSTITYPAPNGAAAGTVAAISGTPVFNPVLASAQLATTTSGSCYSQLITPAVPILVNSNTQRVILEEVFNQTATAATVYQICGVYVLYNNVVF